MRRKCEHCGRPIKSEFELDQERQERERQDYDYRLAVGADYYYREKEEERQKKAMGNGVICPKCNKTGKVHTTKVSYRHGKFEIEMISCFCGACKFNFTLGSDHLVITPEKEMC